MLLKGAWSDVFDTTVLINFFIQYFPCKYLRKIVDFHQQNRSLILDGLLPDCLGVFISHVLHRLHHQ